MNVLFITCSRIGDAVLTTGILSYIEKNTPQAKVTIAVDPLPAPLFEDYPLLDQLIVFPKQRRGRHWLYLWRQVRSKRWDWVIDLRGSLVSYGIISKKRSRWRSQKGDLRHKVEQISALAGIPLESPSLWFSKDKEKKAAALLPKGLSYLAVAPAANWVGKQWPIDSFIKLLSKFTETYPQAKIAVFAAPHEKQMVAPLLDAFPNIIDFIDPQFDLSLTSACIQRCQVFIGNDSGLMHIAAAVKTPTIGLFGPSKENNYGPWQHPSESHNTVVRIPLTYQELTEIPGFSHQSQTCFMTTLTIEKVWEALQSQWDKYGVIPHNVSIQNS